MSDLREVFVAGFEYAEDVGKTTSAKLAAEALRRYPDVPREEEPGLRELLEEFYRLNAEGVFSLPDKHYRLITQTAAALATRPAPADCLCAEWVGKANPACPVHGTRPADALREALVVADREYQAIPDNLKRELPTKFVQAMIFVGRAALRGTGEGK